MITEINVLLFPTYGFLAGLMHVFSDKHFPNNNITFKIIKLNVF